MKVIFIRDLKNQGKKNEIKEVKDGYAMNYLIKNGYAVKYTKGSVDRLDTDLENKKKEEELAIEDANKLKDKLEKEVITFYVSSKNDKVFGTISSKQIVESLSKLGYTIDKKKIIIDTPINTLGSHLVKIELYKKINAELQVDLKSK